METTNNIENIEEKDYNLISNKLPVGVLLFALVLILGLIFIKKPEYEFKVSENEMLTKVLSHGDVVGPEKIMSILFENDSLYRLIDLRSFPDYLKGHLEGAVNIPIEHLLDKNYQEIFNQDQKINVLYYSDHCGACGPWMILSQLGYKNNKIMLGGYDYVNNFILKNYAPLSGEFQNEKPRFDFAKVISETSGGHGNVVSTPASTNNQPVTAKKKKEGGGGGC